MYKEAATVRTVSSYRLIGTVVLFYERLLAVFVFFVLIKTLRFDTCIEGIIVIGHKSLIMFFGATEMLLLAIY